MNNFIIRKLQKKDYNKNYLQLLKQLIKIDINKMNYDGFCDIIYNINRNIYVMEYNNKIIATAYILFEDMFTYNLGKVVYIKDFIIDKFRSLREKLLTYLIELAKINECYKININNYEYKRNELDNIITI